MVFKTDDGEYRLEKGDIEALLGHGGGTVDHHDGTTISLTGHARESINGKIGDAKGGVGQ